MSGSVESTGGMGVVGCVTGGGACAIVAAGGGGCLPSCRSVKPAAEAAPTSTVSVVAMPITGRSAWRCFCGSSAPHSRHQFWSASATGAPHLGQLRTAVASACGADSALSAVVSCGCAASATAVADGVSLDSVSGAGVSGSMPHTLPDRIRRLATCGREAQARAAHSRGIVG